MAKLSLTLAPTFVASVPIPVPGKKPVSVEFTFKARTKDGFSEFIAAVTDRDDLDVIMDIISGWELEDEFSRENVARLMQSYAGAAKAVIEAYVRETIGARLGN